MNGNANTKSAVKTKPRLRLEENKPSPDRMKTGSFHSLEKNPQTNTGSLRLRSRFKGHH